MEMLILSMFNYTHHLTNLCYIDFYIILNVFLNTLAVYKNILYKRYTTKRSGNDHVGFSESKAEFRILYDTGNINDFISTWNVGFIIKF